MSSELNYVGTSDLKQINDKLEKIEQLNGKLIAQANSLDTISNNLYDQINLINITNDQITFNLNKVLEILEHNLEIKDDYFSRIAQLEQEVVLLKILIQEGNVSNIEVFEPIGEDKTISLDNLPSGTYNLKYYNKDGSEINIGSIET